MSFLKNSVKRLGFPILFFSLVWILFRYPGNVWIGYGFVSFLVFLGILLERFLPFEKEWNKKDYDRKSDFVFFLIQPILAPLTGSLVALATIQFMKYFEISSPDLQDTSLIFQVILGMTLSGLIPYWLHRFAHVGDGFLWRAHSIHHSPKKLYWMNAFRSHPFNTIWNTAGLLLPSVILGMHTDAVLIVGLLNNFVSIFNHMNIDFRLGFLNKIFNMNELHRWHHSEIPSEGNNNYSAGAFAIWDHIFGSYFLPSKKMNPQSVGLFKPEAYPSGSLIKQFLFPICKC
ncbi:sterol desaturase family protein [Leptospira sp. 201903071]|uniref:sterol desaturase family protein n=1 Tax=Leptospira ainazelensis TaxID=2810034 RepID=UPI001966A005|nr:sterol desaturase family protein [Leptospira ainazelensis]MBM9500908.1 sterol desaturase family protein [Leptospira ainazelensis]